MQQRQHKLAASIYNKAAGNYQQAFRASCELDNRFEPVAGVDNIFRAMHCASHDQVARQRHKSFFDSKQGVAHCTLNVGVPWLK